MARYAVFNGWQTGYEHGHHRKILVWVRHLDRIKAELNGSRLAHIKFGNNSCGGVTHAYLAGNSRCKTSSDRVVFRV